MEQVHYFGVLVRNPAGQWRVLDDEVAHQPEGLIDVTDFGSYLKLTYPYLDRVGSCQVSADETWCGRYHPGASVGFDHALIFIRNYAGAIINPANLTGTGNLWVNVWGWIETEEGSL